MVCRVTHLSGAHGRSANQIHRLSLGMGAVAELLTCEQPRSGLCPNIRHGPVSTDLNRNAFHAWPLVAPSRRASPLTMDDALAEAARRPHRVRRA